MICTFFGHRDCDYKLEPLIESKTIDLIENYDVKNFYVGNNGNFDIMVKKVLMKLSQEYPQIKYYVVLAYLPKAENEFSDFQNTIYPEGLETVPPKFAISKRNDYMIKESKYLICYCNRTYGGAYKFMKKAEKKGLKVFNIAKLE